MRREHRRISGVLLLAFVFASGLIAMPPTLDRLRAARAKAAALAGIVDGTAPPAARLMAAGQMLAASSQAAAETLLEGVLRDAVVRQGVLVEQLTPTVERRTPAVSLRIRISGPADRVLRFAESIESRTPVIRLYRWRLTHADAQTSALRLDAVAAAVWTSRQ